jgi:succinate dehydrogenase flavin-adding protein (antitoxin of CptAB toxin-antitoxin module)
MKELDLLLLRYLRGPYGGADLREREAFAEFLELPDPDIARYLVAGHVPEDPTQAELCRHILLSH